MKRMMVSIALCLAIASPLFGQKKEAERLANSATVLQQVLSGDLPKSILDKAVCVLVFPGVKKVAIGIGASYGRGALVCRKGTKMNAAWGAPAMYSLDQGSLGVQLGSTATDFVLVIMNQKGADQILNGKTKLGANAAAAAGPTGAQATSYNADAMNVDVLTYSRSKGFLPACPWRAQRWTPITMPTTLSTAKTSARRILLRATKPLSPRPNRW